MTLKKSLVIEDNKRVHILFQYEKGNPVKILEVNALPFYCYKQEYIKKLHAHDAFLIGEAEDKENYEAEMRCEDERVENF